MTKRLPPEVKAANKIKFAQKQSERYKGEGNPFYGKHHKPETIEQNRQAHLGKPGPNLGVRMSEKTKDKLRQAHLRKAKVEREEPPSEDPTIKYIPLTKGHIAIVDVEDYERLNQFLWVINKNKKQLYAKRSLPKEGGKQKSETMQQLVLKAPNGLMIDHINGNGLDNRKSNLRIVTNRQNCQNRHQTKTSRFPGVSWNKRRKKWESQAQINGKHKSIGFYETEELAYAAYCEIVNPIEEKKKGELL